MLQRNPETEADRVYNLLLELRETNAKAEKETILRQMLDIDLGRTILYHTYSPTLTYGVDPRRINFPEEAKQTTMNLRWTLVSKFIGSLATRELSGKAAEMEIITMLNTFNSVGRELLYCILRKDLRAGIGISSINAVEPGFIPEFKVMRAQPFESHRIEGKEIYAEYKLDGYRTTFLCHQGNGGFYTRTGKLYDSLNHAVAPVLKVARSMAQAGEPLFGDPNDMKFVIDSEALTGMFSDTGKLRRKSEQANEAELHIFDLLSYAEFTGSEKAPDYETRRKRVEAFVRHAWRILDERHQNLIQLVPRFRINDPDEIQLLFEKARNTTLASYLARGNEVREQELLKTTIDKHTAKPQMLEGLIIKTASGSYVPRKSFEWLKLKPEDTLDLRVVGAYPGQKETKYEHCLGGIVVDHNGVEVNVGGGFSDKEREDIWQAYQEDMKVIADRHLTIDEFVGGKLIGRLAEVEFSEVTPDGSLRHPRFIRFRDDKDGETDS